MAVEKFIAGLDLQELFRDKDTGLPLSAGTLTFYKDADRLTLKPVYKYTGSPGNPAYTALPNPYTLNSAGYATDTIYYYPYDEEDDVELYFIEIRNSDNVLQNTREAWPPGFVEGTGGTAIEVNFVPNGQFSAWGEPFIGRTISSLVNAENDVVQLASGNWEYHQTNGTTTNVDFTFTRFALNPTPDGNPKFSLNAEVTVNNLTDTERDILVYWNPVNAFASDTDEYTFSFWGKSNLVTNATVSLRLIKNYGSGGSAQTDEELAQFVLSTSYDQYVHTFTFGDDNGKTLGTGTTQVRLAIRLPLTAITDTSYTDFILTTGEVAQPIFPPTPVEKARTDSYLGTLGPLQDGSNLGLPIIQTRYNFTYDTSYIGSPYPVFRNPNDFELLCNGSSFFTQGYSSIGIPYSRLYGVIGNRFGTGTDYATTYGVGNPAGTDLPRIIFSLNEHNSPVPTAPTDVSAGLVAVTNIHTSTENIECFAGVNDVQGSISYVIIIGRFFGTLSGLTFGAGTSGQTMTLLDGAFGGYDPFFDTTGNSRAGYRIGPFSVLPAAGSYFQLATNVPGATQWYVWFQVDGVGADPAPGGTGILVNLSSTDATVYAAIKIANALNSFAEWQIEVPAATGITQSGYWTFDTKNTNYYVWYNKDGGGTDPAVAARTGIEVAIVTADTNIQVRNKTIAAINSLKFAVPDLRGQFLRGSDNTNLYDVNLTINRANFQFQNSDLFLGSKEWPRFLSHSHSAAQTTGWTITVGGGSVAAVWGAPVHTGSSDVVPWNVNVNYVIRY